MAGSVLAAASFYWSPELRASTGSGGPDDLVRVWFPDPQVFEEFRSAHTALGADHSRIVMGDFIALFTHDPDEDSRKSSSYPVSNVRC